MLDLQPIRLDDVSDIAVASLPEHLLAEGDAFDRLWDLHPAEFHIVRGRFPTPRWQQAFGHDYRYSGSVNEALPIAPLLAPYLEWSREEIDGRLNGMLVNWYDLGLGHYIGAHRDSPVGLVADAPIVTISLGVERVFRMRRRSKRVDVPVPAGTVIVLPAETNRRWDHQVPKARTTGRRISITLRAFEGELAS